MVNSKAITRFLKSSGRSREWLADQVGVSSQTIWRYEHGFVIPRPTQQVLERVINDA